MTEQAINVKPRLQKMYEDQVIPALMEKFGFKNKLQAPKIQKVTVNMGLGLGANDNKIIEDAEKELALIVGQKPIVTKAKKAISNFKIREGSAVGCAVVLRRRHMYEFLDRLINVGLPRIRDFRGISNKSFDESGNYSLGLKEHTMFPELDIDKVDKVKGMTVTITFKNSSKDKSLEFLKLIGMPFVKNKKDS